MTAEGLVTLLLGKVVWGEAALALEALSGQTRRAGSRTLVEAVEPAIHFGAVLPAAAAAALLLSVGW